MLCGLIVTAARIDNTINFERNRGEWLRFFICWEWGGMKMYCILCPVLVCHCLLSLASANIGLVFACVVAGVSCAWEHGALFCVDGCMCLLCAGTWCLVSMPCLQMLLGYGNIPCCFHFMVADFIRTWEHRGLMLLRGCTDT